MDSIAVKTEEQSNKSTQATNSSNQLMVERKTTQVHTNLSSSIQPKLECNIQTDLIQLGRKALYDKMLPAVMEQFNEHIHKLIKAKICKGKGKVKSKPKYCKPMNTEQPTKINRTAYKFNYKPEMCP